MTSSVHFARFPDYAAENRDAPDLETLLAEIRGCRLCADELPHEPRPVVRAAVSARILIVGQAPGTRVHETGVPFNDPSGDRLRDWMNIDRDTFYDETRIAIAPMGFCFPGQDARGADRPPIRRCAHTWRPRLMAALPNIRMMLLVGSYAQQYHLGALRRATLTETVRHWRDYWPDAVPLPHPSWRNNAWLKRNPWFETELLPELRQRVATVLAASDD